MRKEFSIGIIVVTLAVVATACSSTPDSNTNAAPNTNASSPADTSMTTTAPDNSEIITTNTNGVKTETRTFKGNPRVSKVVVTTKDGNRTVKVYSANGEEKDVSKNEPPDVLHATGDAIADGAGWVKDKSLTVADKTKEGAKTVADKTVDTTKTVANKTKEGAVKVGDKTVDTTKTVVDKTKEGAKKTGKAIKKIINP